MTDISFDPEFDPHEKTPLKVRPRRIERRMTVLTLLLAAIWLWILWEFGLLRLALGLVGLAIGGFAIVALTFIPTAIGFGLFAIGGRLLAFCKELGNWPAGPAEGQDSAQVTAWAERNRVNK
jgi:hypothetical protein